MAGNEEFILIGEKRIVFERVLAIARTMTDQLPSIPSFVSPPAALRRARSLDELRAEAEAQGVLELFDAMIAHARRAAARIDRKWASCNFSIRRRNESGRSSAVGIWLPGSTASAGLIVNYSPDDIARCFGAPPDERMLPGVATEKRGHLGRSRYLRTVGEVEGFWRVVSSGE